MPRAFLITHRRYNGTEEFQTPGRDYSPERGVRLAEYSGGHPTSDGVSDCGSETSSDCPEELYNLTKLAEVSLAAAAGTLIHPSKVLAYEAPLSPRWEDQVPERYSSKPTMENPSRIQTQNFHERDDVSGEDSGRESELSLRERTRLFFERIESERQILEIRNHPREISGRSIPNEEEEITDSKGAKNSYKSDEPMEQRPKSVLTTLSRKGTSSSSSSSSEGSKSDDSEDHECPDCGKKYSTSSNLARHRQTHRSLGDKKARRCPHCDKIYVSMPAFSMHVRTHNQGCKCHYCGKCFSRPWLLQGHIRTHTGEKPFKCTICNKAFADKSNLRAHVQTHSNTKPHICGRCGKAFALKSYLYKHEESSCMRAHNRALTEKSDEIVPPRVEQPLTASPTSVIVQCPREPSDRASLSTIIRHTKNQEGEISISKRQCREKVTNVSPEPKTDENLTLKSTDFLSRMVIRTSVISPNPEHLVRLGANGLNVNKASSFDFSDPSRNSAFSRPTAISLNLAIA